MSIFQNLLMAAAEAEAAAATGYEIDYAISMDDSDNDYVTWTPSSAGNQQKWTLSLWLKRKETDTEKAFFGGGDSGSSYYFFGFSSDNKLFMDLQNANTYLKTSSAVGSTSTWKHIVMATDSTQGTEENRMKWYIDGTQNTSWETEYPPSQNEQVTWVNTTSAQKYSDLTWSSGANFYMADINFVDGAQLAPTAFGETSGDDWIPIDPSPTYGTNGYRLEFKQLGFNQDANGIGADTSGNDNHFATVNLTSSNRTTDTPTNPS